MLHLMRQSIVFSTTASLLTPSSAPVSTVARVADYANELGSFNRPRDTWFPASVVDTAVALLTGEVGLLPRDAAAMVDAGAGETFTAEDSLCVSGAAYIAAPRNERTGATVVVRARLHGFTRRQLKLISRRVWDKPQDADQAAVQATPVVEAAPAATPGQVDVRVMVPGSAAIIGPGFTGGVRRHPLKPRQFEVIAFDGATAEDYTVIGAAGTYAKAGALVAAHFGQADLPVAVDRKPGSNAA